MAPTLFDQRPPWAAPSAAASRCETRSPFARSTSRRRAENDFLGTSKQTPLSSPDCPAGNRVLSLRVHQGGFAGARTRSPFRAPPSSCGACGTACSNGQECQGSNCHTPCSSDGQCAPPSPYCDTAVNNVCVQCLGDPNCSTTPATPYCSTASHTCVKCNSSAHCSGTKPYCDLTSNACVACLTDTNCGIAGQVCVSGQCGCPTGKVLCGTQCVDVSADAANCGSCGHLCDTGTQCVSGACACITPGQILCNGLCVDPSTSFTSCGGCGNQCSANFDSACVTGLCQCAGGATRCTGQPPSGGSTCFDLLNDPLHCGTCQTQCARQQYCNAGTCDCRPGLTSCNGQCVDTRSNPLNCGGCGQAFMCADGRKCSNGVCSQAGNGANACPVNSCVNNNRVSCVNFRTDPLHCGNCQTVCQRDQICVNGTCDSYRPATPCNTCPCNAVCTARVGAPSSCCGIPALSAQPMCVRGNTCP